MDPSWSIISDCRKAYDCLANEGFHHLKVNHSLHFINPETGDHTNNIERVRREVRSTIPWYGLCKGHFVGYLAEFQFNPVTGNWRNLRPSRCWQTGNWHNLRRLARFTIYSAYNITGAIDIVRTSWESGGNCVSSRMLTRRPWCHIGNTKVKVKAASQSLLPHLDASIL